MQAFVFTDKRLERYAGQFVWLQVDIENSRNAAFLAKYPTPAIPTLMVIDPKKESVVLRYMSGATVPQMEKLLADGRRAVQPKAEPADLLLSAADKYASQGLNSEAIKSYEQAMAKAPKSWGRYGRAAESYLGALAMQRDNERCTNFALDAYPRLRGTMSGANVASMGLGCAAELPARTDAIATLEKATRESMADPRIPLSGDDRSGMYQTLIGARDALKDEAGSHQLTEEWSAFLDAEAAKAKTPEQRAVYDPHRLGAYMALDMPEKAIPMLEQSEKDFPNDYNPPSRLSVAFKALKRYDEALAATDRALAHVYGPRKVTVLRNRADIYVAKGDKENARKTLQEAIDYAAGLPNGQRNENTIASLKKKLGAI
jgi:tetratricopeptide (TPR) repeat protein